MQARIRMLAFVLKDGFSARGRTDGDKGEFPSDRESNDTCSEQSYNGRDNARGSSVSNSSNSTNHIRSECNTSKPADLLRVLTQA